MALILCFIAFLCTYRFNKPLSLIFLLLVGFDGFRLNIFADPVFDTKNLFFVTNFYFFVLFLQKHSWKEIWQQYRVEGVLVILLFYELLHFLLTPVVGLESFSYSFAVFRHETFFMSLFAIRQLDSEDLKRFFKYLVLLTVFLAVTFYVHALIYPMYEYHDYVVGGALRITPPHYPLIVIAAFAAPIDKIKKAAIIIFILGMCIFENSRGHIMSLGAAMAIYALSFIKWQKLVPLCLMIVLLSSHIGNVMDSSNFSRYDMSVWDEVSMAFSLDYTGYSVNDIQTNGTFQFRVLHLFERLTYISKEPQTFLFGIGSVAEVSPNNHMNFFVAQEDHQIDTDDLFWSTPLLRYGMVGIALYIWMIISLIKSYRQTSNLYLKQVSITFMLYLIINSIKCNTFALVPNQMAMFALYCSCAYYCGTVTKSTYTPKLLGI